MDRAASAIWCALCATRFGLCVSRISAELNPHATDIIGIPTAWHASMSRISSPMYVILVLSCLFARRSARFFPNSDISVLM